MFAEKFSNRAGLDPGIFKRGGSTKTIPTIVVEVTRIPIYTNALGSVPTQYFLFLILDPNSIFFLFPFCFCFSFYLLPPFLLPFLKKLNNKVSDILLTSPFFFLIPFFFSSFFSFLFFLFLLPSFIPLLFYSFFYASFLLGMSDQPFEMSGTF